MVVTFERAFTHNPLAPLYFPFTCAVSTAVTPKPTVNSVYKSISNVLKSYLVVLTPEELTCSISYTLATPIVSPFAHPVI